MYDLMDLTFLTEREKQLISDVLNRDDEIRKREDARIERLKSKAARTNNAAIQKKIKMRTGEWFLELAEKQGGFKRDASVTSAVRASMRLRPKSAAGAARSRPIPIVEVEMVEDKIFSPESLKKEKDTDSTHSANTSEYISPEVSGGEETYTNVDNKDKIEELSGAMEFLQKIDSSTEEKRESKKKSKTFLGTSTPNLSAISMSKPTFGSSWSVYSKNSGVVRNDIEISGTIKLGLEYSYNTGTLNLFIDSCQDLAVADGKKLSNPYVKTYLLPDKHSKRKTKAKKKTLNPTYNDTLKYIISESELATRTVNVAVWHDKVGINVFLGEVNISMDHFNTAAPKKIQEYTLLSRDERHEEDMSGYTGDIEVALRLARNQPEAVNEGQLEVVLKNVQNVMSKSNIFVKGYFLPDPTHVTKQKTPTVTGNGVINFDHLFVYTNVQFSELQHRCLELSVWKSEKFSSNRLLGGIRLGPGTGESFHNIVPWMDSQGVEVYLWQRMIQHPEKWIDGQLSLRMIDPWK